MAELRQYCSRKNLPLELRKKIMVVMEEGYRQAAFDTSSLLKQLPKASREELQAFSYASMTWHIPLFWEDMSGAHTEMESSSEAFSSDSGDQHPIPLMGVHDILDAFKTMVVKPETVLYKENAPAFDIFIVAEGQVTLTSSRGYYRHITAQDGCFFGERELFFSRFHLPYF